MEINQTQPTGYTFWQGKAALRVDTFSQEVAARVFLNTSEGKDLRIEIVDQFGFEALRFLTSDDVSIDIPGLTGPTELLVSSGRANSEGKSVLTFGLKRSPVWRVRSDKFYSGRALLINFAHYGARAARSGFEVEGLGWKIRVVPVSRETLSVPSSMTSDEHQVTHQAEFSRVNERSFSLSEGQRLLEDLHYFLSFCRGQWVALSFVAWLDDRGEVAAEQWGTGKVSPWRDPSSWIDEHHGAPIQELFSPFCEKLADATWRDTLSHVVYWLQRAKSDSSGPDGGCVLLQAALERFAWHVLVRDKRLLSKSSFESQKANEQLSLLLDTLSIPKAVPPGLKGLADYAKSKDRDGPGIFTYIRNKLVHPSANSGNRGTVPYYEASQLARWYLELAVLSACDYRGNYSNRTRLNRWVGEIEKVPWA